MTISDLLTLIGILIAILAFISEKNREFVFLKFTKTEIFFAFILFIYIHYLLSFYWIQNNLPYSSIFVFDGFPKPSAWSYLIAISLLSWGIWKIYFAKFPIKNRDWLIKYYKELILANDSPFLVKLIEKYHLKQVINYLKKIKTIKVKKTGIFPIDNKEYNKAHNRLLSSSDLKYGFSIYNAIILNEIFIDHTCNLYPYLFADIIKELSHKKQEEFVNKFLKILTTNKNQSFFREIKNNQNLSPDNDNTYRIETERPILYALFHDINVSAINEAWRGIGETAITEMEEESKKSYSPLRETDNEQENDTIWTYRINIAIWYFDIMVRQAIKQNINNNMWMSYYWHFSKAILSNMDNSSDEQIQQNRHTRNYDLLELIFGKLISWLSVIRKTNNKQLLKSIYLCMGQCIYQIAITKTLDKKSKIYLLDICLRDLLEDNPDSFSEHEIFKYGFKSFSSPTPLAIKNTDYASIIKELWNARDTHTLDDELSIQFENQVMNLL